MIATVMLLGLGSGFIEARQMMKFESRLLKSYREIIELGEVIIGKCLRSVTHILADIETWEPIS